MKTTIKMIATVAVVALAYSLSAGEITTARGAASRMISVSAPSPTTAVAAPAMACDNCKDKVGTVRDTSAKGAQAQLASGAPTTTVSTHLCTACGTKYTATGAGKGATEVASHTCGACK